MNKVFFCLLFVKKNFFFKKLTKILNLYGTLSIFEKKNVNSYLSNNKVLD